ncbi:hypothetical protein V492_01286 [Pseudogymnoascus sp. VKM F-4246]|nr:hypothetical protein V492_01286 [Pseudogymnoascus sp. VKM F-4246]
MMAQFKYDQDMADLKKQHNLALEAIVEKDFRVILFLVYKKFQEPYLHDQIEAIVSIFKTVSYAYGLGFHTNHSDTPGPSAARASMAFSPHQALTVALLPPQRFSPLMTSCYSAAWSSIMAAPISASCACLATEASVKFGFHCCK